MPQALETLGNDLKGQLTGLRLKSLSLHDTEGEALWMSEGVLGPDEHALTLDALDLLQLEPARRCFERAHGDGCVGMVFAAREPSGTLRGVATVVADARTLGANGQERSLQPALQTLLRRLAVVLRARAAAEETSATQMPGGDPTMTAERPFDPRFADLGLFVQQMLRLKTSGRTRRFEVLLRSHRASEDRAPADVLQAADAPESRGALDRHVISQLVQWLAANRDALEAEPASFSVNLSLGALLADDFLPFVARTLETADVNPRLVAFELRESVCRERFADVQRFVRRCEEMKCQIVIDDFTMHSDVLPLLRSPAVRLVKIDAALTVAAMKDKLSQAQVVAISQAAKVLGAHCVAKRIESTMARQWLAAIGVDFAQGFLLEGLIPLSALGETRAAAAGDTRIARP